VKPRAGKTLSRERTRRDVRRLIKKIFAEGNVRRRAITPEWRCVACSRDVLVKRERDFLLLAKRERVDKCVCVSKIFFTT